MPVQRRAKIIATLGPACRSVPQICELIDAGADTLRVNTSHLTPQQASELYADLAQVRQLAGRDFAVLVDLQGPKLRLAATATKCQLAEDDQIILAETKHATSGQAPVDIPGFAGQMTPGQTIMLGDGTPQLTVTKVSRHDVTAAVTVGGSIRPRMGITVPGGLTDLPPLTQSDLDHLSVCAGHADWVALSFVSNADDIRLLRHAMRIRDTDAKIIAKIERAGAMDHLDAIVQASDGVMVARGDLGMEIGLAAVPFAQQQIIDSAMRHAKTSILATQVLESMIAPTGTQPTRAEVADMSHGLIAGVSAIMVSAESATGAHPNLVIRTMDEIIAAAEQHLTWADREIPGRDDRRASLVLSADRLAADQDVQTVIIPTDTGATARLAASLARQNIIALSPDPLVRQQLALERGVSTLHWDGDHGSYLPITVLQHAIDAGKVSPHERVVVVWNHTYDDPANPVQLVAAVSLAQTPDSPTPASRLNS